MSPAELHRILREGPRTYAEAVIVKNQFASAADSALTALNEFDVDAALIMLHAYERWLKTCLLLFAQEVDRLQREHLPCKKVPQ